MKSFLRKHLMIVVSIALPLLVVLFFALVSLLPGLFATPPAYDLLLTHAGPAPLTNPPVRINFTVHEERLSVTVAGSRGVSYGNNPRIFRYDHASGEVQEIKILIPDNTDELPEGTEIPVPELAHLRVSTAPQAPDGYEFRGYNRGGGLLTVLFGGNRHRRNVTIVKDGAVVRLNLPLAENWYGEARFLAWVLE